VKIVNIVAGAGRPLIEAKHRRTPVIEKIFPPANKYMTGLLLLHDKIKPVRAALLLLIYNT